MNSIDTSYSQVQLLVEALQKEGKNGFRDLVLALFCEREASCSQLGNLLAVIHRDGGHYLAEHGTNKAVDDAITKVANLFSLQDEIAKAGA